MDTSETSLGLRWVGHATSEIVLDGVHVLTDPVLSDFSPFVAHRAPRPTISALEGIDVVLISHAHQDHMHLPTLRRLSERTRVLTPAGTGAWLERQGIANVEEMRPGEAFDIGAIRVRATTALHDGRRLPNGPRGVALGYLVQGSVSLYFAGDTDLFDEMSDLPHQCDTQLHTALLPVGGWGPTLRGGHLTPQSAARALQLLHPLHAIPIHWGTYWPRGMTAVRPLRFSGPGNLFAIAARDASPDVRVSVLHPGEAISAAALH